MKISLPPSFVARSFAGTCKRRTSNSLCHDQRPNQVTPKLAPKLSSVYKKWQCTVLTLQAFLGAEISSSHWRLYLQQEHRVQQLGYLVLHEAPSRGEEDANKFSFYKVLEAHTYLEGRETGEHSLAVWNHQCKKANRVAQSRIL